MLGLCSPLPIWQPPPSADQWPQPEVSAPKPIPHARGPRETACQCHWLTWSMTTWLTQDACMEGRADPRSPCPAWCSRLAECQDALWGRRAGRLGRAAWPWGQRLGAPSCPAGHSEALPGPSQSPCPPATWPQRLAWCKSSTWSLEGRPPPAPSPRSLARSLARALLGPGPGALHAHVGTCGPPRAGRVLISPLSWEFLLKTKQTKKVLVLLGFLPAAKWVSPWLLGPLVQEGPPPTRGVYTAMVGLCPVFRLPCPRPWSARGWPH